MFDLDTIDLVELVEINMDREIEEDRRPSLAHVAVVVADKPMVDMQNLAWAVGVDNDRFVVVL